MKFTSTLFFHDIENLYFDAEFVTGSSAKIWNGKSCQSVQQMLYLLYVSSNFIIYLFNKGLKGMHPPSSPFLDIVKKEKRNLLTLHCKITTQIKITSPPLKKTLMKIIIAKFSQVVILLKRFLK